MGLLDPSVIRAAAQDKLGPLVDGPATWGVLPEGVTVETAERQKVLLTRSEPCLFLGPPRRSKLVLAVAILDPSEIAEDPVRLYAMVNVADLAGLWAVGLEDAVSRFPKAWVKRERPEVLVLPMGTVIWTFAQEKKEGTFKETGTGLSRAMAAISIGREAKTPGRRAIVLVRAIKALEPAYYDDGTASSTR